MTRPELKARSSRQPHFPNRASERGPCSQWKAPSVVDTDPSAIMHHQRGFDKVPMPHLAELLRRQTIQQDVREDAAIGPLSGCARTVHSSARSRVWLGPPRVT